MAPALFDAFVRAMELDRLNKSIEPVIEENSYGIGKILVECFLFPVENPGSKRFAHSADPKILRTASRMKFLPSSVQIRICLLQTA